MIPQYRRQDRLIDLWFGMLAAGGLVPVSRVRHCAYRAYRATYAVHVHPYTAAQP